MRYNYYIYLDGKWYTYNSTVSSSGTVVSPSCTKTEHTHGDSNCQCDIEIHTHSDENGCYSDSLHSHNNNCYNWGCDTTGSHEHTAACYLLVCTLTENHTHTNSCNSSTSRNIKTVSRKYGQYIGELFPVVSNSGKVYNEGQRWKPSNSSYYSEVLVCLQSMPPDDFTLTLNTSTANTFRIHYMMEVLPGKEGADVVNGYSFIEKMMIAANYNYLTRAEDFFDIPGFTQYTSKPKEFGSGANGQLDIDGGGDVCGAAFYQLVVNILQSSAVCGFS
jgi:hypothetical protein